MIPFGNIKFDVKNQKKKVKKCNTKHWENCICLLFGNKCKELK